jgi:hypothetical protein
MTKKLKPADEIDSYCTKCKLDLAHRIISMEGDRPHKVECQTCHSHHLYRRPKSVAEEPRVARAKAASAPSSSPGKSSTPRSSSAKAMAAAQAENQRERDWERRVSGKGVHDFKPYRTTTSFDANDLVRHLKFGDGYVVRVIDKNKIEVMFRDGIRTLAHGIEMA